MTLSKVVQVIFCFGAIAGCTAYAVATGEPPMVVAFMTSLTAAFLVAIVAVMR